MLIVTIYLLCDHAWSRCCMISTFKALLQTMGGLLARRRQRRVFVAHSTTVTVTPSGTARESNGIDGPGLHEPGTSSDVLTSSRDATKFETKTVDRGLNTDKSKLEADNPSCETSKPQESVSAARSEVDDKEDKMDPKKHTVTTDMENQQEMKRASQESITSKLEGQNHHAYGGAATDTAKKDTNTDNLSDGGGDEHSNKVSISESFQPSIGDVSDHNKVLPSHVNGALVTESKEGSLQESIPQAADSNVVEVKPVVMVKDEPVQNQALQEGTDLESSDSGPNDECKRTFARLMPRNREKVVREKIADVLRSWKACGKLEEIEKSVDNIPSTCTNSISDLAMCLKGTEDSYDTESSLSQIALAYKIFCWVTKYIEYDKCAAGIADPQQVLKLKKAVCHGYTTLFQAIASESGLKVSRVDGNYRSVQTRQWTLHDADSHTWNMVSMHAYVFGLGLPATV